jgi:hypothetical protein
MPAVLLHETLMVLQRDKKNMVYFNLYIVFIGVINLRYVTLSAILKYIPVIIMAFLMFCIPVTVPKTMYLCPCGIRERKKYVAFSMMFRTVATLIIYVVMQVFYGYWYNYSWLQYLVNIVMGFSIFCILNFASYVLKMSVCSGGMVVGYVFAMIAAISNFTWQILRQSAYTQGETIYYLISTVIFFIYTIWLLLKHFDRMLTTLSSYEVILRYEQSWKRSVF